MPFELPPEIASSIPAEHLNHTSIQRYNSVPELIKGHVELQDYRGRSIAMPNGESKPEDFDKWATEQGGKLKDHGYTIAKLGDQRPESPDAYQYKVEGVDNEVLKGDELMKEWRKDSHELNLNNKQSQAALDLLANKYLPRLMPKQEPAPEEIKGAEAVKAVLTDVFKADFPQVNANYNLAIKNLQMDNPELTDVMKDSLAFYKGKAISVFDHPVMRKIFSDWGASMQQDFGGNITSAQLQASNDAQAEIKKIRHDPNHPMHAGFMKVPPDPAVSAYMSELYKKLTGGK